MNIFKPIKSRVELRICGSDLNETITLHETFIFGRKKETILDLESRWMSGMILVLPTELKGADIVTSLDVQAAVEVNRMISNNLVDATNRFLSYLIEDLADYGIYLNERDEDGKITVKNSPDYDDDYEDDDYDEEEDYSDYDGGNYADFKKQKKKASKVKSLEEESAENKQILIRAKITSVKERIDDALDKKNKELFLNLSKEYKELKKLLLYDKPL